MELDKRVGEYAAAIVQNADRLLENATHLNNEQQQYCNALKSSAVHFLSLYNEFLPSFKELRIEPYLLAFDLRAPLSGIAGYCELLGLTAELGTLDKAQLQLLHQIKEFYLFILNALTIWVSAVHKAQSDDI